MATALKSLVRETGDPNVFHFAAERTTDGRGSAISSCAKALLKGMRTELVKGAMSPNNPLDVYHAKMERLKRIFADTPDIFQAMNSAPPQDVILSWRKRSERHFQDLLKHNNNDQDESVREFWDNLLKESDETLTRKLTDPLPMMRWAAINAIAKKRIHREQEMIDLLGDDNPLVRQAAHDALVVLSRGNDFGPMPGANPFQQAASRQRWRHWLALQDSHSSGLALAP